jgi:hypothetical protein
MPAYNDQLFLPPAPVAIVVLRNPESGAILPDIPMLIDSGADVTLLPQYSIDLLGAEINPDENYELIGFDGAKAYQKPYTLT